MGDQLGLTRREFLELSAVGALAVALPAGCGSDAAPGGRFLTEAERRALAALADLILPPQPGAAGGSAVGAVPYIDGLLAAFEFDPPRIHAGGPYSGRQPYADPMAGVPSRRFPPGEFANFLPLDRVATFAWRLRLYGSRGVPSGGPNDAVLGAVTGLRDQIRDGLAAAANAAGAPIETLDSAALLSLWNRLPRELTDTVAELVLEATLSAPEYGGNRGQAGWRLAHFAGDSQPLGYSLFDETAGIYRERPDAPVSTADPTPDPDPLTDDTRQLLATIVDSLGGRRT